MVEARVLEDVADVAGARDVVVTSWTRCCSSAAAAVALQQRWRPWPVTCGSKMGITA